MCAFMRGGEVLVAVATRERARYEPPPGFADALGIELPGLQLLVRTRR
jgi:hypothetical protein